MASVEECVKGRKREKRRAEDSQSAQKVASIFDIDYVPTLLSAVER